MGSRAAIRRILRSRKANGQTAAATTPASRWFWEHYEQAPGEIVSFCREAGLELARREIADVGCGDGIMALGLFQRVQPKRLVGYDVNRTNVEHLLGEMRREGVAHDLPQALQFQVSGSTRIPAADEDFDFVYSWSAFEHVSDPVAVLLEIRRILRPTGQFFLQVWPFYRSPMGSHLWDWFEDEFHHLLRNDRDIVRDLERSDRHARDWTNYMTGEFERLNRITVLELQRAVLAAGFDVRRLELLTSKVTLSTELARYAWSDLCVSGVKLPAIPRT